MLEEALGALGSGGKFDDFARATRGYWEMQARRLMRRWQTPADVEVEDVVQELLLGAWKAVPRFDPARGKTLVQYVRWNAISKAKKFMHRQRCALRRDDKARSRHPLAFSRLRFGRGRAVAEGEAEPDEMFESLAVEERQEQVYELETRITRLESQSPRHGLAARVLARCEFDPEDAAEEIYLDVRLRRVLQLGCEDEARTLVRRALDELGAA